MNARDNAGRTALLIAASAGNADLVRLLLDSGADLKTVDSEGVTVLAHGTGSGSLEVVRTLLAAGADPNQPMRVTPAPEGAPVGTAAMLDGTTALMFAALVKDDRADLAGALIDAGAQVNTVSTYGITAINFAASTGNTAVLQRLLSAGASISIPPIPLLATAAENSKPEVVRLLLSKGADPNVRRRRRQQPFPDLPLSQFNPDVVRQMPILANTSARIFDEAQTGNTPLISLASVGGDVEIARMLIQAGADVNAVSDYGNTALVSAVDSNSAPLVQLLLDAGADPEAGTSKRGGFSPLYSAALKGAAGILDSLLKAGAAPDARFRPSDKTIHFQLNRSALGDKSPKANETIDSETIQRGQEGCTALHAAASVGSAPAIERLVKAGADANARNKYGQAPLDAAAGKGDEAAVKALLAAGARTDLDGKENTTPLHEAAAAGHLVIVQVLLESGAHVNSRLTLPSAGLPDPNDQEAAKWMSGLTPLHFAAMADHAQIASALLKAHADPHARNTANGFTLLHVAAIAGNADVIAVLLEGGADVNETAKDGSTALKFARKAGKTAAVATLRKHGGTD